VSKKQIIIAAGLGLLSFVGAFGAMWFIGRPGPLPPETATAAQQTKTAQPTAEGTKPASAESKETDESETTKGLTEK